MDPRVLYWTGALANMALIVALVAAGIRFARRGEVARHKRAMLGAALLVVGFVLSYVAKLALVGREALDVWSATDLWVLRFHESCVAAMLVGGGIALVHGLRLGRTRIASGDAADPPAPERRLRWHRRAGWVAAAGALLGVLSAGFVLQGMYERAAESAHSEEHARR